MADLVVPASLARRESKCAGRPRGIGKNIVGQLVAELVGLLSGELSDRVTEVCPDGLSL